MEQLIRALNELTHELHEDRKARKSENSFRCHADLATKHDIERIINIMAKSQAEVTAQLTALNTKAVKIGSETRTLIELVKKLTDAAGNQTNASPELEAAANALEAQLGVVDELVDDRFQPLNQAQVDALAAASLALTQEQLDQNTAGTGPVLNAAQVAALVAAGIPATSTP